MAEKQVENLLKYIAKKPELLNTIKDASLSAVNAGKSFFTKKPFNPDVSGITGGSAMNPGVASSLKNVASTDSITSALDSLDFLNKFKTFLIIFLVLWTVAVVITRFVVKEEKQKEDLDFVHKTLFGQTGMIPNIVSIWVGVLIVVTLVPVMLGVLPKIGTLSESIKAAISEGLKIIPSLF